MASTESMYTLLQARGDLEMGRRLDEMRDSCSILFERLGEGDVLPKGQDIAMVAHTMRFDTSVHTHDYYELMFVSGGEVVNVVDGKELFMGTHDLCVMGLNSSHSLHAVYRDATVINICLRPHLFQTDYFREFLTSDSPTATLLRGEAQSRYLFFPDNTGLLVETLVYAAAADFVGAGFCQSLPLTARVLQLLCETTKLKAHSFHGIDAQTLDILLRISEHPETATVASVAAEFGYSPNYFAQFIRKHTGYSPKEIITKNRMEKAARLLRESDLTVEKVAAEAGYRNCGNFHVSFKRHFGKTPDQYRRASRVS